MSESLKLREERANLIKRGREIVNQADSEKRPLTDQEQTEVDNCLVRADELADRVKTEERKEYLSKAESDLAVTQRRITLTSPREQRGFDVRQYNKAVQAWFRYSARRSVSVAEREAAEVCGVDLGCNSIELRTIDGLSLADDSSSNTDKIVPTYFLPRLQNALESQGGIFPIAYKYPTDHANTEDVPTGSDLGNAAVITSEGSDYDISTPTFGKVSLKSFKYTTCCPVTEEMLLSSAINLEQYIVSSLAERFSRGYEPHFVSGNGTAQPQGLKGNVAEGSDDETLTYNTLVDMFHACPVPYRNRAVWVGNDSTCAVVKKLLDGSDRPLLLPMQQVSISGGINVDSLLGKPFVVSNYVDEIDAGNTPLYFGDFSTYWVRLVRSVRVRRLDEVKAASGMVVFLASMFLDGRLVQAVNESIVGWNIPSES